MQKLIAMVAGFSLALTFLAMQASGGSGSLPTEAIPSLVVSVSLPDLSPVELGRRLRLDRACIFGRIQDDCLLLDVRTLTDEDVPAIAAALSRVAI